RLAGGPEVRLQRDRVERDERVDEPLHLPRRAEEADVRAAPADHGEVGEVRAQDRPDHRHRLAPRPPAAEADRHAGPQLGDGLLLGAALVAGCAHRVVFVSRLATNASRCSSATPERFSSNVNPCSKRYERFTSQRSIPLRLSLAARITVGDFAAIWPATAIATSRSCAAGTTSSTDPNRWSPCAVAAAAVYPLARALGWGARRARWVAAPSAPRSTSGSPKVASSAATITSALPTSPMPPPRQYPCTAATTGTAQS